MFSYLAGLDYLKKHADFQDQLARNNGSDTQMSLPLEMGCDTGARIYADRLFTIFGYPLILALRLSGVDAIVKKLHFPNFKDLKN